LSASSSAESTKKTLFWCWKFHNPKHFFVRSLDNQQKSDKKAPNARASGIIIICIFVVINRTLINHESKI